MMLNKTFYLLLLSLIPLLGFSQANSQYPDSGNKIRLGFQTTGDGLIWRDTQPKVGGYQPINNKAAWIILDTINNKFYHYKNSTWTLAGGQDIDTANLIATKYNLGFKLSLADTQNMLTPYWRSGRFSGVLPVANGGTNASTLTANKFMIGNGTNGVLTPSDLHYNNTNGKIGFGVAPEGSVDFQISNNGGDDILFFMIKNRESLPTSNATVRFDFGVFSDNTNNYLQSNTVIGQSNYIGQANDASYVAGKVDVIVTNAGNVGRGAGHSGIMRFYTKPTNDNGALERMRINEVGNVGIGQTTPNARLHVNGSTNAAEFALRVEDSGGANLLSVQNNGATTFTGSVTANSLSLTTPLSVANGGTGANMSSLPNNYLVRKNSSGVFDTSIVYEANGRVGIGTNNPTSILDLASSASSLNFSARLFTNGATGPSFTFIKNRGTLESPLPVQLNDNMGELNFSGAALIRGFNSLAPGPNFLNGGLKIQITSEIDQGSALRFIIISNGFTGIGVTVPTERLHVGGNGLFTGSITTNSLTTNGIVYSNAGTLTNTNPSDSTLKNSINSYTYGLSEILQLKPKTFYYNLDVTRSHLKYGFIAQEVQPIMPNLVRIIGNGSDKLGLESEGIYVAMVNAIKELSAEIDILKQEIINLKNK